jgi:hypothetical protein
MEYKLLIRNKFICFGAKTFNDYIIRIEDHLNFIKDLQANNVKLLIDGVDNDYAEFITDNELVAKEFGFEAFEAKPIEETNE